VKIIFSKKSQFKAVLKSSNSVSSVGTQKKNEESALRTEQIIASGMAELNSVPNANLKGK